MTKKFDGKVALVTGGASGIGRASALAFAREGAKVILGDVAVQNGEGTAREIKGSGGEATFLRCDVAHPDDVLDLVMKAIQTYGRLDYAFNNAGIVGTGLSVTDCTPEDFDSVMAINVRGVWLCMKYEIPEMIKQGGGTIVNAASISGLRGTPNNPTYGASKAAVVHLTRSAALEYARSGIRVNALAPGYIHTPMTAQLVATGRHDEETMTARTPMGRIGEPADIVETVLWLCSNAASFITGQVIPVDGGLTAGYI